MVIKVDTRGGHIADWGRTNQRPRDPAFAIAVARENAANRVLSHAVTGRLSNSGGVSRVRGFFAVPTFADVVLTGSTGTTKATLDASLALVNDALAALFIDANAIAVALGIAQATYAGGGTAASPIAAITDSGTATANSATAANMNPIRDQIDTNMHTVGAVVNKIARALGHEPVDIESSPDRQPPPDTYAAGSTGTNPGAGTVGGGGSGQAFGKDSPFTSPTPAITENSGTHGGTGVNKVTLDAALTAWRDNVETLATRLAVFTNTVVALTDSSTGAVGTAVNLIAAFPADTADSGTSLAGGVTTDAEMADIRNAVASMFAKLNALAAGIGAKTRVYDGLGTASDTLAAIGAVTAVATGVQQTEMEAWRLQADKAFDSLAEFANDLASEVDVPTIARAVVTASFPFDNPVNALQEKSDLNATERAKSRFTTFRLDPTPGVIPVTGGTPADPGQQKTDVDTRFTTAKDNIATVASTINAIRTAFGQPLVKFV